MLLSYAALQLHRLQKFGETVVTSSETDSFFDYENAFPKDITDLHYDNFNIAFGITKGLTGESTSD